MSTVAAPKQSHPQGLYPIFFTEMWERFGYYLLIGILFLYMTDNKDGGLGLNRSQANDIYGTYIALVYLTPFLGGLLADRIFGYRKTIIAGALLMSAGYFTLAIPGIQPFLLALLLVIVGNGLFKPNISTLLGNLYNTPEHSPLKDKGYNIFYMGINIGAFACNFVAAYLRNNYGWGYAFASAGVGMLIGLVTFVSLQSRFSRGDVLRQAQREDMPLLRIFQVIFLPAILFAVVGYFFGYFLTPADAAKTSTIFGSQTSDAFLFACVPVVVYYASLFFRASKEDRGPIGSLLYIFLVVIIFWAIFHQNGNVLTEWAERNTWRAVPTSLAGPAAALGFAEEATENPAIVKNTEDAKSPPRYVIEMDGLDQAKAMALAKAQGASSKIERTIEGKKPTDDKYAFSMPVDSLENGRRVVRSMVDAKLISFDEAKYNKYLATLPTEQWPRNESKIRLFNTELFQSLNPFFVVVLTPVVVAFFSWLAMRGKEPSTAMKLAWGLAITAFSTLVMVAAVYASNNGEMKVSPMWLVSTYAVITIGELCLSPMGLSLVSKLSPPRITSLMMGGWFLSTSIGNKFAGVLGHLGSDSDNKSMVFWINFTGVAIAAFLLFIMVPRIDGIMKTKTGNK